MTKKKKILDLRLEYLLRVVKLTLIFNMFWAVFWALIYESVVWKKPFIVFRNLDLWVSFSISVMLLALINLLLAHPELWKWKLPKLKRERTGKTTKKKPKKKEKDEGKPIW